MAQPTCEAIMIQTSMIQASMIQLDRVDTALESPDADKAAVMREAQDWPTTHSPESAADALYYRERLQAIRERHGAT